MADAWLVAGLGNPGARYAETRHNVGAMVTGRLATRLGGRFRKVRFLPIELAEARHGTVPVLLTQPGTWMNDSGPPIASLARKRGVAPERLVVVHDEIDLPLGAMRIKRGGSTAGHHGLDSIVAALRSPEFFRIRIGVGRPSRRDQNVDFVLDRFSKREREEAGVLVEEGADAVLSIIDDGLEATQNRFNRNAPPD
jgi:peptidyl-tRNA hydrolase, PTH1 family